MSLSPVSPRPVVLPSSLASARAAAVAPAAAVRAPYGVAQAMADMDKLARLHRIAGENRGVSSAKRAEFERNKPAIAQAVLSAARRYFPELPLKDGARLLLADISLESTFDPKLNVGPKGHVNPTDTVGLMQARGASNLLDFKNYALPQGLKRADGHAWNPRQAATGDLAKIWENVHVGAWYISQMGRLRGVSVDEYFKWNQRGTMPTTVAAGLLSHLMGPRGAAEDIRRGIQNPGAQRYLRIVGGELDYLDKGLGQRVLGTQLRHRRV